MPSGKLARAVLARRRRGGHHARTTRSHGWPPRPAAVAVSRRVRAVSEAARRRVHNQRAITVELSDAQVDRILLDAADKGGFRGFLFAEMGELAGSIKRLIHDPALDDPLIAATLVRGFAVFACFYPPGRCRAVKAVAEELEITKGTAHRYLRTLMALGFIEDGEPGEYRLAAHSV